MFFGKEKELVKRLQTEKENFLAFKKEVDQEIRLKDTLMDRLNKHIEVLKNEILAGKKIFRDPVLSMQVSRKFRQNIAGRNLDDRLVVPESDVSNAIRIIDEKRKDIEYRSIPSELDRIRGGSYDPSKIRIVKKVLIPG